MLVRVEMRGTNARLYNPPHLRCQLVVRTDRAGGKCGHQLRYGPGKCASGDQRFAADQHQVCADIKRRRLTRQLERVRKRGSIRHQRGGSENTATMGLDNTLVHVRSEPEIVGVHYELFTRVQNNISRMVRNFFGFARMSLASD